MDMKWLLWLCETCAQLSVQDVFEYCSPLLYKETKMVQLLCLLNTSLSILLAIVRSVEVWLIACSMSWRSRLV